MGQLAAWGRGRPEGSRGVAQTPFLSLPREGSSYLQSAAWPDHSGAAFDAELKGESASQTSNGFGRGIWVSESLNHPPAHPPTPRAPPWAKLVGKGTRARDRHQPGAWLPESFPSSCS